MKRLAIVVAVLAAALSLTASAYATGGKLKCFTDAPGTCKITSNDSATLNTSQGTGAPAAGVYYSNGKSLAGTPLAAVDFTFNFNCGTTTDTTTCVSGGAPRWSIPVDFNGDGQWDAYAFLDAPYDCSGSGNVSTTNASCRVNVGNDPVLYANWDALAGAHPTWTIANALPFIIVDVPTAGPVYVSGVNVTRA